MAALYVQTPRALYIVPDGAKERDRGVGGVEGVVFFIFLFFIYSFLSLFLLIFCRLIRRRMASIHHVAKQRVN